MTNDKLILSTELAEMTIKCGMLSQVGDKERKKLLCIKHNQMDVFFDEDSKLEIFEKQLMLSIKEKSWFSFLKLHLTNRIGSILTIFVSLLIVLLIVLLSIHGSMTYDLFLGQNSSNILHLKAPRLYLLLSLVILVFLVLSPKIILGQFDNLFDWAKSHFSTHGRIQNRLTRELNTLNKLSENGLLINLWNPLIPNRENWISTQLIPSLYSTRAKVDFYIRTDEKENLIKLINEINPKEKFVSGTVNFNNKVNSIYDFRFLSSWEKELFHCFLFSSTLNIPKTWTQRKDAQIIISKELSEQVFNSYESKLLATNLEKITFENFINRCIEDYGYLISSENNMHENYILTNREITQKKSTKLLDGIKDSVKNDLHNFYTVIRDPQALLILIGLLASDQTLNIRKIELIQRFIENVRRTENYWLIKNFWDDISKESENKIEDFQLGILHFLDVPSLNNLATSFVNAGLYKKAMGVYKILENIYPAKIAIEIADLKDSLGDYNEALAILLQTDEVWVSSKKIEDKVLILNLFLNIAWVVVSGRFEEKKDLGYQYLQKTEDILRSMPNAEDYVLFLTRYYNTLANYHEWEKQYSKAIENYKKALMLPGTLLRKSSLLSNWGIAERFLGKESTDIDIKKTHLQTSHSIAKKALSLKKGIGEINQIPGTSHNLCETLVELASITENSTEKLQLLEESNQVSETAITILNDLGSNKRMGRLLTERYITHKMLDDLGENSDMKKIETLLRNWFENEDKTSFDYRATQNLLTRFDINFS